jgi:dethiobiotin synthetase
MPVNRGWFVTGTDTGVGKTLVSLGLMQHLQDRGLRVAGMKPVASGCMPAPEGLRNEDALRLQQQSSIALDYALINPYAFAPAIAPHLAAAQAGIRINMDAILSACARIAAGTDRLVVEGAGGWLVPLNETESLADLAGRLDLEVILVVGIRLGCLNHALLSVESIQRRGRKLAGWVANCLAPADAITSANIATLEARVAAPLLGIVPFQDVPDVKFVAENLALPADLY